MFDGIPTRPVRKCPHCHRALNVRVARHARGKLEYDPGEVVITVRCHRSDCGRIVPLTAEDLHFVERQGIA